MEKDSKHVQTEKQPDPFITQNVWIKRLGLFILVIGMFPVIYASHPAAVVLIGTTIVVLAVVAYAIKFIRELFKSLWY